MLLAFFLAVGSHMAEQSLGLHGDRPRVCLETCRLRLARLVHSFLAWSRSFLCGRVPFSTANNPLDFLVHYTLFSPFY